MLNLTDLIGRSVRTGPRKPDQVTTEVAYRDRDRPVVEVWDVDRWREGTVIRWNHVSGQWQAVVEWMTPMGLRTEAFSPEDLRPPA